jgi:hypothetical protein
VGLDRCLPVQCSVRLYALLGLTSGLMDDCARLTCRRIAYLSQVEVRILSVMVLLGWFRVLVRQAAGRMCCTHWRDARRTTWLCSASLLVCSL